MNTKPTVAVLKEEDRLAYFNGGSYLLAADDAIILVAQWL